MRFLPQTLPPFLPLASRVHPPPFPLPPSLLPAPSRSRSLSLQVGERLTDEEIQEMIDEADRDGDGEIGAACVCAPVSVSLSVL